MKKRKLVLHRETLLHLGVSEAEKVRGGSWTACAQITCGTFTDDCSELTTREKSICVDCEI